ncbi:hypothetical protein ABZ756_13810 [Mammaliicoccus sciuri]
MNDLWIRKASFYVAGKTINYPDLHFDFKVDFDVDPEPSTAEVKIYNLSKDTISKLKKGMPCILNAGYQSNSGSIFTGGIITAKTTWSGVDKITTVTMGDGAAEWMKTKVSKTFKQNTRASQVIRGVIGLFGLEVGEIQLEKDVIYKKGKVVHGPLQRELRQIVVNDCKSKLLITNSIISIRPKSKGVNTGFMLNSDTGLVGTPEQMDSEDADYSVTCLLNHRIREDSLIRIESRTVTGNFRVVKGSHDGSSWHTKMEVKAV